MEGPFQNGVMLMEVKSRGWCIKRNKAKQDKQDSIGFHKQKAFQLLRQGLETSNYQFYS